MISFVLRTFLQPVLILFIVAGCALQNHKVEIDEAYRDHPAVAKFLSYNNDINAGKTFSELKSYFTVIDQQNITNSKGWYLLAYTSSFIGLTNGDCRQLDVTRLGSSKVKIDCTGDYKFKNRISGEVTDEFMHIQTILLKQQGNWYISSSGLAHTQLGFNINRVNKMGITFKHNLSDLTTSTLEN